ncbi:MAG: M23 family metallopeptidase [Pyrinomonadaceae bacterium]
MNTANRNDPLQTLRVVFIFTAFAFLTITSCGKRPAETRRVDTPELPTANGFAYPVGEKEFLTEAKDSKDNWFNAQDFEENDHLGEDWNANSGGDSDCGMNVFAAADGSITYAGDAGAGWGNVIIITHRLPNGKKVQTLYGHLETILRSSGKVSKRQKIGTIGNANGKYLCHLHFEVREETCFFWDKVFNGYSRDRKGWLDPSEFIDKHRPLP